MTEATDSETYKQLIDRLVQDCHEGQGQIGPDRVRRGIWNPSAERVGLEDQVAINDLLLRLPAPDRRVLASMIEHAFVSGVHQALVALYEAGVTPFDTAYEGSPFHDFVGRLAGWEWPADDTRSV